MNKLFSYFMYIGLVLAVFSLGSCQKEHQEISGENPKAIKASSSTGQLIQKASAKNGSYDDVVDGASCFAINFPYVVHVNGQAISINSMEELDQLEELFDDMDDDFLELVFPVTITLSDYSEITIKDEDQFEDMVEDCLEGGDDDDIECIHFVYPITVYSFDINLQQTGKLVVGNDMELRRYFSSLDDDDLLSFDFPISLKLYDDMEISVNNNEELAAAIEDAKDICDDDNDFFTQEDVEATLVQCPWSIREVERGGQDISEQYLESLIFFNADGIAVIKDMAGNEVTGSWSASTVGKRIQLKLDFATLPDFSMEWIVDDLDHDEIELEKGDGNEIEMKKTCDIVNNTPDALQQILEECSWIIKEVKINDVDMDRLLGYEFNFLPNGKVALNNGTTSMEGTWGITKNAQGRLVMAIVIGDEPGVSFEWILSELRDKDLEFSIEDSHYKLELERVCDNNNSDADVVEIRNWLQTGNWVVAKFEDNGVDETTDYAGLDFTFSADLLVTVSTDPVHLGLWRITRSSKGKLKCFLNFGTEPSLDSLSDDWKIVSIAADRLELRDSGDDSNGDLLVFVKN